MTATTSELLYDRALRHTRPFQIWDLIPKSSAPHAVKERTRKWLAERVRRGELKRTETPNGVFYEWVN